MIKILKQVINSVKVKNKAGLSSQKIYHLSGEFVALDKIEPGLSQRILNYIIDDEDEEILLELGGCEGCGKALKLPWCINLNQLPPIEAVEPVAHLFYFAGNTHNLTIR